MKIFMGRSCRGCSYPSRSLALPCRSSPRAWQSATSEAQLETDSFEILASLPDLLPCSLLVKRFCLQQRFSALPGLEQVAGIESRNWIAQRHSFEIQAQGARRGLGFDLSTEVTGRAALPVGQCCSEPSSSFGFSTSLHEQGPQRKHAPGVSGRSQAKPVLGEVYPFRKNSKLPMLVIDAYLKKCVVTTQGRGDQKRVERVPPMTLTLRHGLRTIRS